MNYNEVNSQYIFKKIQKVLKKKFLWKCSSSNLKCLKLKCFNYQTLAKYKIYIKKHKCELCKTQKQYNRIITHKKNQKYDICAQQKKICQCMEKKYYTTYTIKKEKFVDCKELLSKCTTNSNFSFNFKLLFAN